jgi:hypothetical protein
MAIAMGIIIVVAAAVLPVSPVTQGFGPFKVDLRNTNCGPAGLVAFDRTEIDICRSAAQRRMLAASAIGLIVVALGMALFAGPEQRRESRIEVKTPHVRRGPVLHNPGSKRYMPD